MIDSKTFDNVEQLNSFIAENKATVISINEVKERVNTGLPLPRGGTFSYDADKIKLWYSTNN